MIIGQNDQDSYDTISNIYHDVIRVFVDKLEQFSFSMAMYLPEFNARKATKKSFFSQNNDLNPADKKLNIIYSRILFRTPVANLRSDFNGLELYTVSFLYKKDFNWFPLNLIHNLNTHI